MGQFEPAFPAEPQDTTMRTTDPATTVEHSRGQEPTAAQNDSTMSDDSLEFGGDLSDVEPSAIFPISIDADSRLLRRADGHPFLLLGDSAWSLMVQLTKEEVDRYISARQAFGFNTVVVELIEHKFSSNPPYNRYGDAPFTSEGDFSTPNDAYFKHVDWVLQRLRDAGFLVLLTADYLGWQGGDEGWWHELMTNGVGTLREYGRYVGERYRDYDNIVWIAGGDYNPPQPELVHAIADAISEADPGSLHTAHLEPDTPPRDFWSDADWLDIDNVYTYSSVFDSAVAAYEGSTMPFILLESSYENEHDVSIRQVRTQAFHALLTRAAGHVYGNNPMWHFDSGGLYEAPDGWEEELHSPGARSMAAIADFMSKISWWELHPDLSGQFLLSELQDGQDRMVAAVSDDRTWAVVYVPSGRTVELDLDQLSGSSVSLTWYDPTTAGPAWTADALGRQVIEVQTPGTNSYGDGDWLLVIRAS